MADEVLQQGVRGITDLMVMPGLINLDFADVRSVMGEMGKAMMGTGEASGDNRAIEAAEKAISNPLLDGVSMKGAKGVIISITGGEDMRLMEVDEAASHIKELVDPDANIIWGSAFNNDLGGKIRVSVVATGIEAEAAIQPTQGKVFTFPTAEPPGGDPGASSRRCSGAEPKAEEEPLDLTSDDEATDELLLGQRGHPRRSGDGHANRSSGRRGRGARSSPIDEAKPAAAAGGTLFERMSNIARGAPRPRSRMSRCRASAASRWTFRASSIARIISNLRLGSASAVRHAGACRRAAARRRAATTCRAALSSKL